MERNSWLQSKLRTLIWRLLHEFPNYNDCQIFWLYGNLQINACFAININRNIFSNINLLHLMQDSIKQQKSFTANAAANVEIIASYRWCYEWFYSIQTQVYRHVASYSYFKVYGESNSQLYITYATYNCGLGLLDNSVHNYRQLRSTMTVEGALTRCLYCK